jgi:hypothetical protein
MKSRSALLVAALLVLVAGAGGVWWWRQQGSEQDAAATAALSAFAAAWVAKDVSTVPFADTALRDTFPDVIKDLGKAPVEVTVGDSTRDGDTASADLAVRWTLPGEVAWSYSVPTTVTRSGETWQVATPSTGTPWHPDLPPGETFSMERTTGERGDLVDRAGDPLMPLGTVHNVAIDPVNATPEAVAALEPIVDADAGSLTDALAKATASGSKAPIPVISYRDADWEPRAAKITALAPSVIAPTSQQPLAVTRTFGQPLLGTVGEVTAEVVDKSEGRYVAGDRAGLSGLQAQYDQQLAGDVGLRVETSGGVVLFEQAATDGTDVVTTLDPGIQSAAEEALAAAELKVPGAIVAVHVPTGEVLAAANSPSSGFDRALTGRYPPGSTFKVATTYAYLTNGIITPTSPVPCPKTTTVDGLEFGNFGGAARCPAAHRSPRASRSPATPPS